MLDSSNVGFEVHPSLCIVSCITFSRSANVCCTSFGSVGRCTTVRVHADTDADADADALAVLGRLQNATEELAKLERCFDYVKTQLFDRMHNTVGPLSTRCAISALRLRLQAAAARGAPVLVRMPDVVLAPRAIRNSRDYQVRVSCNKAYGGAGAAAVVPPRSAAGGRPPGAAAGRKACGPGDARPLRSCWHPPRSSPAARSCAGRRRHISQWRPRGWSQCCHLNVVMTTRAYLSCLLYCGIHLSLPQE